MTIQKLALSLIFVSLLPACAPVLVTGVAVGASVAHDRRTAGAVLDDQTVEMKAGATIATDHDVAKQVHINITSMNGIVLLTGEANTLEARDQVLTKVRSVQGIRRITNEIVIGPVSSIPSRTRDTWITGKVKTALLTEKDFDSTRIKVVTENSVVYLMGLVTQQEADTATRLASDVSGITRVVKVFEFVEPARNAAGTAR
jgi:osmotically-inducible protein OsmY